MPGLLLSSRRRSAPLLTRRCCALGHTRLGASRRRVLRAVGSRNHCRRWHLVSRRRTLTPVAYRRKRRPLHSPDARGVFILRTGLCYLVRSRWNLYRTSPRHRCRCDHPAAMRVGSTGPKSPKRMMAWPTTATIKATAMGTIVRCCCIRGSHSHAMYERGQLYDHAAITMPGTTSC